MTYILFAVGFILLIKGADLLVDGAASIAKSLSISNIVIGLTIVAFGTSAPELVVSAYSAYKGNTDLAIANVLGSNIANTLLILGASAVLCPLIIRQNTARKEIPFSLLSILLVGFLANDSLVEVNENIPDVISRTDSLALLCFFALFLHYTFSIARLDNGDENEGEDEIKQRSLPVAIVLVLLGLAGLTFGGQWIVDGAVSIAESMEISQRVIGLTVVAFGTSLPELAACMVAAWKKQPDLVVGGIIGSNIFNLLWILGAGSMITNLPFDRAGIGDIIINMAATALILIFLLVGKLRGHIERWQGALFVLLYFGYMVYTVIGAKS